MARKLWDEIPPAPAATGAAAARQHLPPSAPHSVSKHLDQPQGSVSPEMRDAAQGQHGGCCRMETSPDGSPMAAGALPTGHTASPPWHPPGWNPAWPDQVGWEILPKALQPSKHGTIQHGIILKVKIVYCCLCRNALTSPVLFLYLAVGLQA